jgi:NAD(P)-dependent dehydrogenase (short-subunit alcohol dehydrogenase family)
VAITVRKAEDAERLAAASGCRTILVDLEHEGAIRAAGPEFGTFDLVVNCAGISEPTPFLELQRDSFTRTMAVNVWAATLIGQFVGRGMIARGQGGAIVNVSSIASFVGIVDHAAYCASKAALDAITRVMALELGPHGIRVNSVNPVVTLTEMAARAWSDPEKANRRLSRIPLGHFAKPEDVADVIVYLLGSGAAMLTGLSLNVDGGFRAV